MEVKFPGFQSMKRSKAIFTGVIILYFLIGLEILIMISPVAGVFVLGAVIFFVCAGQVY